MNRIVATTLIAACLVARAVSAQTVTTPEKIARLRVHPSSVLLGGIHRGQQLLVTAESDSGRLRDVTHSARFSVQQPGIVEFDHSRVVSQSDGQTEAVIDVDGVQVTVPITVRGHDVFPPIDFAGDVVPLLSKLGCNRGGCHGKASGQNGFRLSVFGFDPSADYNALVKEGRGRRVFLAAPEESLLVKKTIGAIAHGGGQRTEPGSDDHHLLLEWIRQGAPRESGGAPVLVGLQLEPSQRVMSARGSQQIVATALYSDGSQRDVTSAATYSSNAEEIVKVEESGRIDSGDVPGEAAITVNYMGQVGTVRILLPRATLTPYPTPPSNNSLDTFVWNKLSQLGIEAAPLCDDATFLRRLYVDAIGTLPTTDEVRQFLADPGQSKRARAIEQVLDRGEFADYWALIWSDILLVNREKLGERGAYEFHRWLRTQIASNRPYDVWVREIITASGNSARVGPANFYRALRTPEDLVRSVSQAFLGLRMDCAQCHHHPFDRWGQDDFYGMAGFFNGLERKRLAADRELIVHSRMKPATMPLTGKVIPTRTLAGESAVIEPDVDPRQTLADWMTARDNPWFAKLVANRLWKHFLGRGLVEPEDDLRSTNPATNEPLLEFLTEQVVEHDFDLRNLMRLILNSRVYQLSSATNETNREDTQNFSHHFVRRLRAEVLLDAVSQVSGSPEHYAGKPSGTRSIQLWDNRLPSYFLDTFGRSQRDSPCACGSSGEPTMAQALHLMNAPELEEKIRGASSRAAELSSALDRGDLTREQLVDELCLMALGRSSREHERRIASKLFELQPSREATEDFLWSLLNSYEFLFVH